MKSNESRENKHEGLDLPENDLDRDQNRDPNLYLGLESLKKVGLNCRVLQAYLKTQMTVTYSLWISSKMTPNTYGYAIEPLMSNMHALTWFGLAIEKQN
jgi:hypothetical protein